MDSNNITSNLAYALELALDNWCEDEYIPQDVINTMIKALDDYNKNQINYEFECIEEWLEDRKYHV